MNEIQFDLIRRYPRNIFRIAMGALLLASVAYFLIKQVAFFSLTHLLIFTLGGLYYLFMGFGINPITIWGKAYIKVSQTEIAMKPTIFAKATVLDWANVKEARINITGIRFILNQGVPYELSFDKLNEENIQKLKHAIISLSKEKGVILG